MKNVFHVFSRMFTKFLGEHPFSSTHSAHLASASRLRSVRIGLALILTLFAAASSWATDYITDVMVLGGDKSTISQMKSDYEQKGWIFIDDDLNDGAGGDYIHVLYKKSSGYSSNVITDIIIKTGEHPDSYIFNGRTYYRAPHDGSEYFKSYGGNLNSATTVSSSTNMRLYYTKEEFSDKRAVSKIAFTVADDNETKTKTGYTTLGRNGAVVGTDGSGALDLNEGAGSDSKYIYMHISTVQPPLADAPEYITDVVVLGGSKDEVNALKERYASQGWVVIDQDLNDNAGAGTDYVYLAYKKSPLSEDGNGFITDFIIKTDDYPDTYKFNGRTYYRTPNFGSEHFESHGGNLNSGTVSSSTNMRLYFTREKFPDKRAVSKIAFTVADDNETKTKTGYTTLGRNGAVVGTDGSGAFDLNEGAGSGSDYIYMHFATAPYIDVTFVTGDENVSVPVQTIVSGAKPARPDDPKRKDLKFLGWYITTDGNTEFDFSAPVASNTTVYAKWEYDLSKLSVDGSYVAQDGFVLTGTLASNSKISIADGATVTLSNAVINGVDNKNYRWAGLTCEGNCKIVLDEGSENSVKGFYENYPGIYVPEGYTLTIEGSGKLDVIGGYYAAGIGGGYNISCGNIVINGGTVTVTGGYHGAGIGGGYTYGTTTVGNITINGGTVTATGGTNGAGIGGGLTSGSGTTTVGDITINGGTVTATSGYGGAGIGCGHTNNGTTTVGNITINGGTVNATGRGSFGAGIGGGDSYEGTTTVGDITINGGTVNATGDQNGAGIGGGYIYKGTTTVGDITINGGTVTATSGYGGAGIGSGHTNNGTTTVGNITINGGTVNATGGQNGAGIGGGYTDDDGTTTVGDITINGGLITAKGFVGIGKGKVQGPKAKAEIGSILLYHGFKEIDATITGNPIYMYGETDVSSNPSEYFGIDGSITRSLYSIHYAENNLNGSVKGNNTTTTGKAYAGETVTATPDFGYSFKSLSVKDDEGKPVGVKNNTFVMPQGDVTVSADFASKYPMLTFSDNGKKVTVNGTYGGTETFELDEDITVENVVFNREFAVGVFSTLTLPFDVSTEYLEGFGMVLTFNGLKQKDDGKWVVRMKKFWEKNVTSEFKTLDAYTPYLVLMDESSLKVNTSVQILTTKEPIAKAAGSNWEFRGTLAYKKWEEGDSELGRVYGFAAESKDGIQAGQFVKAGAGAYIYPLRAYLLKKPAASGVRSSIAGGKSFATMSLPDEIDVEIEDDDGNEPKTTVVGKFNTRTGEFRMNSDAARSFDVKGRNVGNKANKARGAYYKKGGKAAVTR